MLSCEERYGLEGHSCPQAGTNLHHWVDAKHQPSLQVFELACLQESSSLSCCSLAQGKAQPYIAWPQTLYSSHHLHDRNVVCRHISFSLLTEDILPRLFHRPQLLHVGFPHLSAADRVVCHKSLCPCPHSFVESSHHSPGSTSYQLGMDSPWLTLGSL